MGRCLGRVLGADFLREGSEKILAVVVDVLLRDVVVGTMDSAGGTSADAVLTATASAIEAIDRPLRVALDQLLLCSDPPVAGALSWSCEYRFPGEMSIRV